MSALAITVPKTPLAPAIDRVCELIRTQPERRVELCGKLGKFLEANGYSAAQVAAHLISNYEAKAAQDWIDWFAEFEVFSYERSPTEALTSQPATARQDPQTVLQPEKILKAPLPVAKSTPDSAVESGVIKALAGSSRSALVLGRDDLLSADLLRMLAKESLAVAPETELRVIDLGIHPWLGLHCDASIVAYVTRGADQDMLSACELIKAVWQNYQAKTGLLKQAMRNYQQPPNTHPVRLLVTGWPLFYSWAKTFSGVRLADYHALAKAKSINKPLEPTQAVACVGHLIAGGSTINVACYLAGQEPSAASTGLSADVLLALELLAFGAQHDYSAALAVAERSGVSAAAQRLVSAKSSVLVSTQLGGQVSELPDYSDWRDRNAVPVYRDTVVKLVRSA